MLQNNKFLKNNAVFIFCGFLLVFCVFQQCTATLESEAVEKWAQEFGDELWELGKSITKSAEIKSRYISHNAQIEKKDVTKLLKSVVENVSRMLSRKMDAIKCILNASEQAAEAFERTNNSEFTYYSSKYSPAVGANTPVPKLPMSLKINRTIYANMTLNEDTNFYNLPVNTSHSSVHVPSNIYDLWPNIRDAIEWSEILDETFVQNYASDPALSWQYFCSSQGILRHYPAMQWNQTNVDLFDCRRRSWYIEAATCSKDVVILFDTSGSMRGYRNWVAQLTIAGILNTFSNNDFVNILRFSKNTTAIIPCFADMLIQATFENINFFRKAMAQWPSEGYARFDLAFEEAFRLLEKYRTIRGCNETNQDCNQAIMLVTDGVPGNLTEVFTKYNRFQNGSYVPVRIFTYLVGREVTKVREIQWLACLNRGYYVHIHDLEEVADQVLKYIPVIAQPLVLQGVEHPLSWTHAFLDLTSEQDANQGQYRLLTSVAVPAYDLKVNMMNDTKTANLLGVAGTDVPLEDFEKLTLPYKLGVNAYAFIVSNNGYLLMHPDLRPMLGDILKENYNSIDLTEVEQVDDDREPRDINPTILLLREHLVNHSQGNMTGVPVKFHYDNMRRVARQNLDFYFSPLYKTPFSLGMAIPQGYGNMWIKVGDELKKNLHMGVDITQFFGGDNWRLHPKWVYCRYHYVEGHEFNSSEAELIHFLHKMSDLSSWKWSQQYEADPLLDDILWGPKGTLAESREFNCGRKTLDDNAYYCNKELVQRLVFDAKVTQPFTDWNFKQRAQETLFQLYNIRLRFIATMSGLTRWQYVRSEDEDNANKEFGDLHAEAIDETWYKSAVLQHEIDAESFVFSVPIEPQNLDDLLVTASHAIFPRDGGNEAPGSVVGYQFEQSKMYERFMQITEQVKCKGSDNCIQSCSADEIDCYVLDSSGYIIISEEHNDTGRFFGEIEGAIMESMIHLNVYQKIRVYDYQALCFYRVIVNNAASAFLNPIHHISRLFQWIVAKIMWFLIETNLYYIWDNNYFVVAETEEEKAEQAVIDEICTRDRTAEIEASKIPKPLRKGQNQEEEDFFNQVWQPICTFKHRSCDKYVDLYTLQQEMFIKGDGFNDVVPTICSRPFLIKRIPHTNLMLVVVKSLHWSCYRKIYSNPQIIEYSNDTQPPCHKLDLNYLIRRRLSGCYTEHPEEELILACGNASTLRISILLLFIILIINKIVSFY